MAKGSQFEQLSESSSQEEIPQLPSFLNQSDPIYQDEGRIMMGLLPDSDVTQAYGDYLESVGKKARSLPSFLYESEGRIYTSVIEDSDVTEQWREWMQSLV